MGWKCRKSIGSSHCDSDVLSMLLLRMLSSKPSTKPLSALAHAPQGSGGSPGWLSAVPTHLSWLQHCSSSTHFDLSVLLPFLSCDPRFMCCPVMIAYDGWRQVKEVQRPKERKQMKKPSLLSISVKILTAKCIFSFLK